MPLQFLSITLGVSLSLSAILLADRERYVHGFRNFDLSFYSSIQLARSVSSRKLAAAHIEIAKKWLNRSEDFRRTSVYLTLASTNMLLSAASISLSLILDALLNTVFFISPFVIAIIFFVFSVVCQLIRYGSLHPQRAEHASTRKFSAALERASFWLARRFPPGLPLLDPTHLFHWQFVWREIQSNDEIRNYHLSLPEVEDLERLGLLRTPPGFP